MPLGVSRRRNGFGLTDLHNDLDDSMLDLLVNDLVTWLKWEKGTHSDMT